MFDSLSKWLFGWLKGGPHFRIGSPESPYMLRWYVIPRNPFFNIYIHKFLRSDDDRAMHDHPWWFLSVMLWGKYAESLYRNGRRTHDIRTAPSIVFRRPTDRHIVSLLTRGDKILPCWTLVFTGRKVREWGFWCPKGFVRWQDFVDHRDNGNVGRGCGEMP